MIGTFHKVLEYRSIYAQHVAQDRMISGEAELGLEIHGLDGRRLELFGEIVTFVEDLAAEKMYPRGLAFLEEEASAVSEGYMIAKMEEWEAGAS